MPFSNIEAKNVLVWLTNILVVSCIAFISYFFVQFRDVQLQVATLVKDVSDIPNLRQREVATEKEISDIRNEQKGKLSIEEHLRFRDQMESVHIENLKTIGEIQQRISNLPKEFPPPPWFIAQFDELRANMKEIAAGTTNSDSRLSDRLARVETILTEVSKKP